MKFGNLYHFQMVSCVFVFVPQAHWELKARYRDCVCSLLCPPSTNHTPVFLRISTDSSRLVALERITLSCYRLVSPVWYWLVNINNCVPILICEYLGSRRQRRQISAPQGFPSLMWKAEHTYMKGHKNKYQGIH